MGMTIAELAAAEDGCATLGEIAETVGGSPATVCRDVQRLVRWLWRSQVTQVNTPLLGPVPIVRPAVEPRRRFLADPGAGREVPVGGEQMGLFA